MHGLPVIAHRGPLTQYVLGSHGVLGDLSQPEGLSGLIAAELKQLPDASRMQSRWAAVRDRFSWPVLAGSYGEMFRSCASPLLAV
jgi:hypothetical protein